MKTSILALATVAIAVGGLVSTAQAQWNEVRGYNIDLAPDVSAIWVDWPGEPLPLLMLVQNGDGPFLRFWPGHVFGGQATQFVGLSVVEWALLGGPCAPTSVFLMSRNRLVDPYYPPGPAPFFDEIADFAGGLVRQVPATPFFAKFHAYANGQFPLDLSISLCKDPVDRFGNPLPCPPTNCELFLSAILCRVTLADANWKL